MSKQLIDPKTHKDWLTPHSIEWYSQLGKLTGQYSYPWNSTTTEPNGESTFTHEVSQMVQNKKVLDIGCGHGEYTRQWSRNVKKIVGLDVTNDFVKTGNEADLQNVRFITANTKKPLPFEPAEFDCAYNRRGPTSVYLDVKRIIKKGGQVLGLHPGDGVATELPEWFPILFDPVPDGTPILDNIKERLERGGCGHAQIETIKSIQYLHEPIDIVRMRCFGQKPAVSQMVIEKCMSEITRIFEEHATDKGLPTTFERYIVRVTV